MKSIETVTTLDMADAEAAIQSAIDESVSLLLPCNVVLTTTDDGTLVRAVDPRSLMDSVATGEEFEAIARDAAERITRAIDSLPTK
jgi:uncharacterized protein (DUF302 family)